MIVSHDAIVQAVFEKMVEAGTSPRLAEMLALRTFPGVKGTDNSFLQGRQTGRDMDSMPGMVRDVYLKNAEKAGVSIAGKVYVSGLARYPADPKAWVSGRGDVKARCESEGWGCRGAVSVETPEFHYEEPKHYTVDPALIAREVAQKIAAEPELARKKEELTHEIATLRAGVKGA